MGLLGTSWDDPQTSAMMALSGGLLRGDFGGGLLGANEAYAQAKRDAFQNQLGQLQLKKGLLEMTDLERKTKDADAARQVLADFYKNQGMPQSPAYGGPTNLVNDALPPDMRIGSVPPMAGYKAPDVTPKAAVWQQYKTLGDSLAAKGLVDQAQQYYGLAEKMRPKFSTTPQQMMVGGKLTNVLVGEDGTLKTLDGYGVKPDIELKDTGGGFQAVDKNAIGAGFTLPKTGNPYSDLILSDGQGGFRQNAPLIGAKQSIAKAGATNVRIENKLGEGIAAQVGPMLKDSYVQANGAAGTVDAANRIIQAADSGSLIAGPGANARLKIAQWGDLLGVAGKDTAEKIANTRQAIRGLAEMTLQGRKQMRGEGQITEQESALAERAASGNLEDLTVAEVKQLAKASDRAARFIYGQHQQMVDNLTQDPNTAGLAKFYKPLPLPQSATSPKRPQLQPKPAQPGPDVRFLGFE